MMFGIGIRIVSGQSLTLSENMFSVDILYLVVYQWIKSALVGRG